MVGLGSFRLEDGLANGCRAICSGHPDHHIVLDTLRRYVSFAAEFLLSFLIDALANDRTRSRPP